MRLPQHHYCLPRNRKKYGPQAHIIRCLGAPVDR